ncbi:MAG TPA: DUF2723 domain-containing protein [Vicinamibacterales bacterium]|nr:DUF2723 domain-containing protein [Vicinamibacterales bacterium]
MAGRQLPHRNQGRTTLDSARTRLPEGLIAAATGALAFVCYYATLLPGLDFGDSASFQTGVGSLTLTPRQAYPLYYALGNVVVWLHPGEPARALNFASAIYGAGAVGIATLLVSRIVGSNMAGLASGLFLAFSYTFWSQAITAEVYTLHLLIVGATILTLLRWAERQTVQRLAVFYAVYAVGFGNHLSMILLLPALAVFVLIHRCRGAADPLKPRMIALALAIVAAAALQYAWNFRGLWSSPEPPLSFADAVGTFWFDVTKADWRQTLVMNVSETGLQTRPSMYWFDVRQQVGLPGVVLAAIGSGYTLLRWPSRGLLLLLVYFVNVAFAWTYNVGDVYIFFLPSHYALALCAGAGVAAIVSLVSRISNHQIGTAVGVLCILYAAWRGYDTFPAIDRSWDTRSTALLNQFTRPPDHPERRSGNAAIYGVDTNWQIQNAFEYFMREHRPGTPWFTTDELDWLQQDHPAHRFEHFVEANREIGREVLLAPGVYERLSSLGATMEDATPFNEPSVPANAFVERTMAVRTGTPYALAVLRSDRAYPFDKATLASAWSRLTADSVMPPDLRQFTIVIGRAGTAPLLIKSEDRPYRLQMRVDPFQVDIRMEAWLPTDTIRRAGFGHVIVDRRHTLTLERGMSFATLEPGSEATYHSGLFSPIPRYTLGMQRRP